MSCKRKLALQLTLLSLIIIFNFSCKKEQISIEDQSIKKPPKVETPSDPPYDQHLSNTLIVLESEQIIRNLVLQSIYQLYLNPELQDLHSSQAITRSDCPSASISDDKKVVTLTYDGCNTSSTVNYSGTITLTIEGTLGDNGTSVEIELSDDFTVEGDQDIDGSLLLEYDGIENTKYDITQISIDNNSSTPATQVRLSNLGHIAHFILDDVNGDDDNSNPLTFLDNEVLISPYFTVLCPNPDGVSQTTLDVEPFASDIKYSIVCGMPFDGEIQLSNSGEFHSSIDFAYPSVGLPGVCDNEFFICIPDGLGLGDKTCEADTF